MQKFQKSKLFCESERLPILFDKDILNLTRKMSSDLAAFSALEKRLEELERRVHGAQMNKNEEMIVVPKLTGKDYHFDFSSSFKIMDNG